MSAHPTALSRAPQGGHWVPWAPGSAAHAPRRRCDAPAVLALRRAGPWLLRASLAIVLVWFGALKATGVPTLTAALIAAISPTFVDATLLAPVVGGVEVLLGLALLAAALTLAGWRPTRRHQREVATR